MFQKLFILFVSVLLIGGCYPAGPEYYEDLDVVATSFERDFDFQTPSTFTLPDKIVKIDGGLVSGEEPEYLPSATAAQILSRIRTNMETLGWVYEADPEKADVAVLPAVWTNTTVFYWYDYWCWYYPYYCGWGWGYPSVASYTSGTLLMAMTVNDEVLYPSGPYRVWTGAVNGLLSGAYNVSRVNNGIDQAFLQSPYLKTN
jgi:hypothetical protein